jgi:hypothetical protein
LLRADQDAGEREQEADPSERDSPHLYADSRRRAGGAMRAARILRLSL